MGGCRMGCYYQKGIVCSGFDDCKTCGWNPAVEEKRKAEIGAQVIKSDKELIADLTKENMRLRRILSNMGRLPDGAMVVKWV